MEINEIEYAIAINEMTAPQVFMQMNQQVVPLQFAFNRLFVLAAKHCPKDDNDWDELKKLSSSVK